MPTQPKVNPVHANIGRSFNGKTVQAYTVNLQSDVSGKLGAESTVQRVLLTLAQRVTPVLISDLNSGNTSFDYYVEGDFPEDDYNGTGTPVTLAAHLQAEIQALGTVDGVNLASATVTAGEVFYADHIPA